MRRGARVRATDGNETPTRRSINILHWNAQAAYNKKVAFAKRLYQENIGVAFIQETHPKKTSISL